MDSLISALMDKYGNGECDGKGCYVIDVTEDDLSSSDIPQYIANFECYISRLKEIHWSCDNDKTHILCDELVDKLKDYQDDLAEDYMGWCGEKFKIGFLKSACDCDGCQTLPDLLKKLREDTKQIYNAIMDAGLKGIEHTLNDIVETINTYLYKETQK